MSAIWFGVKIGAGIAMAMALIAGLILMLRKLVSRIVVRKFLRAGFLWEENRDVRGWLTRDPNNDDWILWDWANNRMLRSSDNDSSWRASPETVDQCLTLGRQQFTKFSRRVIP